MSCKTIKSKKHVSSRRIRVTPIPNLLHQIRDKKLTSCDLAIYHAFDQTSEIFILIDPQTACPAQAWSNGDFVTMLRSKRVKNFDLANFVKRFNVKEIITNKSVKNIVPPHVISKPYYEIYSSGNDDDEEIGLLEVLKRLRASQNNASRQQKAKKVSYAMAKELDPSMTRSEYHLIFGKD